MRVLRHDIVKALLVAQLAAAVVVALRLFAWLQPFELRAYDLLRVAWTGHLPHPYVVLVGVSEPDLHRWGQPLKDGLLAQALERLASWGPRAIGVDIYRDMPQEPGQPELDRVLAAHPEIFWVFNLGGGGESPIPPPKILRDTERAVLADITGDTDAAIVRRGLLYAGENNDTGMGLALALRYLEREKIGRGEVPGDPDSFTLGRAVISPLDDARGPYVKLDDRGYQVLLDYRGGVEPFPLVTLGAVMDGDGAAALVRDRVVILGTTAESMKDWFSTPFGGAAEPAGRDFGITIHARLADQLIRAALDGDPPLTGAPRAFEYGLIWLMAMAGAVASYFWRDAMRATLGIGGGTVVLSAAVWGAFGVALWLPGVPMALAWIGSAGLANRVLHGAANRARAQLRRSFEHYLPPTVIEDMIRSRALPRIGGERREISVIFTDIQDFTTMSERMDPEDLAAMLNRYFTGACGAVFGQGGLVYEFIGDAILAFFGAPHDQPDHADRAVDAALALDAFASQFRRDRLDEGCEFGNTRIGVHTGIALVGNIGTPQRLKYTALGDMLNTGSRLEGLNKVIGTRICVSGDTVRRCERHRFRRVGDFVVKGRHGSVAVYQPLAAEPNATKECLQRYQAAVDALDAGEPHAADLFAALYRDFPEDSCTAFHHRRLVNGEVGALIVMDAK